MSGRLGFWITAAAVVVLYVTGWAVALQETLK